MIHAHSITPCISCHEKNNNLLPHTLQQLLNICRMSNIQPAPTSITGRTYYDNYYHCRYGLSCNDLKEMNNKCNRLKNELVPYLYTIATSDDNSLYHDILNRLRGHLPKEYRQMEQWHRTYTA